MSGEGPSSQRYAPGWKSWGPRSSRNGTAGLRVRQGDGSQDGDGKQPVSQHHRNIISTQAGHEWSQVGPAAYPWSYEGIQYIQAVYSESDIKCETNNARLNLYELKGKMSCGENLIPYFCIGIWGEEFRFLQMYRWKWQILTWAQPCESPHCCAGIAMVQTCQPCQPGLLKMAAMAAVVNWTVQVSALWMSHIP